MLARVIGLSYACASYMVQVLVVCKLGKTTVSAGSAPSAKSLLLVHAALVPQDLGARSGSVAAARCIAGVGALTSVNAHVRLEMATRLRAIPTARHITGVGALASVSAHVSLEIATRLRAIPTARHIYRHRGARQCECACAT